MTPSSFPKYEISNKPRAVHFYVEDSFAAMAKLSDHLDSFTE